MKKVNGDNYGAIISVISKEYIDTSNFEEVLGFFNQMLEEPKKHEGKVHLMIEGYDDDKREIFEIPEIRDYFTILDKLFPYWFYFISREIDSRYSSLNLIMMLLVPIQIISGSDKKKSIECDRPKFIEFMKNHFYYLNELTENIGLSLEENKKISYEVLEVFKWF